MVWELFESPPPAAQAKKRTCALIYAATGRLAHSPAMSPAFVEGQPNQHWSFDLEAVKSTPPIYLPLYIPFVAEASRLGRPFPACFVPSPFLWVFMGSFGAAL